MVFVGVISIVNEVYKPIYIYRGHHLVPSRTLIQLWNYETPWSSPGNHLQMFEFLHLCQFLPISLILPTSSQDRRLRCRVPVAAAQGRAGSDEDLAKATTEINAALLNARSAWVNNSCLTSLNRKMLGTCHGRRLGQTMMIDVRMYDNVRIYIYILY